MLLIGSHAAKINGLVLGRNPADYDVIATDLEVNAFVKNCKSQGHEVSLAIPTEKGNKFHAIIDGAHWDFEIAWSDRTAKELTRIVTQTVQINNSYFYVADLNTLYALKMSHRFLRNSPHFYKTMADIKLMRKNGLEISPDLKEWYKLRVKETYWYKHPKLNVSKEQFFKDDSINYIYDHDSIHVSVAKGLTPAYVYYLKPGSEVECDRALWEALPKELKLKGVAEEAYVLALERSQIPFKGKSNPYETFKYALMKVCTSITSGWFREFAWENHDEVLDMYDATYVDRFWMDVKAGEVKPFDWAKVMAAECKL